MFKRILLGFILLLLSSTAVNVLGQEKPSVDKKPKIGLVLSGGGAKGLAHIGVLKVLEEVGIKPDFITGTSMGSIVGSLYAAGYTAEELTEINRNADWEQLLTDYVKLQRVAMDEKAETKKYLFEFAIKDNKVGLPAGLIEGQHLEDYFAELFWPLTSHEDFEKLPIPFHCMSVDMVSGEVVEHKSGNIVQSIRASMSIPTVFSPVHLDSMLLVDGGVARNFPVQEIIDMGADIIIGVYVGFDNDITAQDLSSMTDILMRSTSLGGIVDAKAQFPKVDILIHPDLESYGAGDFQHGATIQELGEKAARKHYSELKLLADSLNLKFEPVEKINQPEKVLISDIEVENLKYLHKSFVTSKAAIEVGDSVSHDQIREAIEYVYGTQNFRKLTYSLKRANDADGYTLVFHAKENPRAAFKFTPNYDDDLGVGLVANFTLRDIVAPSSRMLISLNIAENPAVEISLSALFGKKQRLSDKFYLQNNSYKLPLYEGGERLGTYHRDFFETGYGFHYSPGLNHQIGGTGFYKFGKLNPRSDLKAIYPEANFNRFRTHDFGYRLFYAVNTTDDLYFPKRGIKLDVMFEHTLRAKGSLDLDGNIAPQEYFISESDDPFFSLSVQHNWYKTFGNRVTYNFGVGAGITSEDAGLNGVYILGGSQFREKLSFKNFAGYNFAELFAPNYAVVKSALRIEMAPGLYLESNVNVGNIANKYEDLIEDITDKSLKHYYWGYNIGLKYDSLIGPVQIMVADNNKDGEVRFHFSVGFPF